METKEAVVKYKEVKKEDNRKIMLGCDEVATGEDFKVYQSENRNVLTIDRNGIYYHITIEQIVNGILEGEVK